MGARAHNVEQDYCTIISSTLVRVSRVFLQLITQVLLSVFNEARPYADKLITIRAIIIASVCLKPTIGLKTVQRQQLSATIVLIDLLSFSLPHAGLSRF